MTDMPGPARKTVGPRFSGGYQFPRTDSAQLRRGTPIRIERLGDGAFAQIVPLAGGRRRMFDVCGSWTVRGEGGEPCVVSSSAIAHDQLEATALFVGLVREILGARK